MSAIDELVGNARAHAERFDGRELPLSPRRRLAIVACMDARLALERLLGLEEGDAHVIRNAGAVITDDEIRSLAISQHVGGTEEVMVIGHTRCGMVGLSDEQLRDRVERDMGVRPDWSVEGFSDLEEGVRQSMARIRESPFLPCTDRVRGFVYELETGRLREVDE
jgi:carbonic anhydrase